MKRADFLKGNGYLCFSEICLRHMGPYHGEPIPAMTSWEGLVGRRWHRDGGERFMCGRNIHCFSISPESVV
jgi:hypothetical protein